MPHVYPFIFHQRPRKGRPLTLPRNVDVTALLNVCAALQRQGYEIGEIQLNYPAASGQQGTKSLDLSAFDSRGVILTLTRPDLSLSLDCRKTVQKGFTPLEAYVEAAWRRVVKESTRLQMVLQPFTAPYFAKGFSNRRNVEFNEREGARYKALPEDASFRPGEQETAACLLRVRELWPGGPGYLGCCGMGASTALAWSQLLRHRHADLLQSEGFFMAELNGPLPDAAENLRWAETWRSEIILRAPTHPPENFSLSQNRPPQLSA
jgi:hypothetical protein